jgi:hypothetical protein
MQSLEHWSFPDIVDAHSLLDAFEDAEAKAQEQPT